MGNCLNPASKRLGAETMMTTKEEHEESRRLSEMKSISQVLQEEEEEEEEEGFKVKMVLTRAELDWLMAQLKTGERRLEDVLHHMHAVKGARAERDGGGWRPRLESILECPPETTPAATAD